MDALTTITFLTVLTERTIDAFFTPIFDKLALDKFYLKYIAWVVSGLLVYFSGANVMTAYIPNPVIGQVATAIIAGGGANILHDITKK